MLEIGTKAPEFSLPDQNGLLHSLSQYRGQKVILYFYPKDMTAGCTKQACGFSEMYSQFQEKGAINLGVSKDSVASHKRFEEKYGLPFTLLADPEKTWGFKYLIIVRRICRLKAMPSLYPDIARLTMCGQAFPALSW